MSKLDKLLALAREEIGYLEKASPYDLDSKYGNAGTANYTKYARDVDQIPDLLNGRKQGYAWCTIFFLWCLAKCFGAENVAKLCYLPKKSLAAGCKFAVEYYKAAGKYGKVPQVGAQIFFADGSGVPSHTGIVTDFDGTYVYTIEGNTSGASGVVANGGCVAAKTYRRDYSRICGYGYPDYDSVQGEVEHMNKTELEALIDERAEQIVRKILSGAGTEPSDWAVDELAKAQRLGITDGTRPKGYAKREEVAAMILRAVTAEPEGDRELPPAAAEAMTNDSY